MGKNDSRILRVDRSKDQAKKNYNILSRVYDYFIGVFEKKYRDIALDRLNVRQGETVLEIGFGTGHSLKEIAKKTGADGKAFGIDISSGMLEVTGQRLDRAGLLNRVELNLGDAAGMPYGDKKFDAVFMSFTLELFDSPEIPGVLDEIKRVLKPHGRLGCVSMSREYGVTFSMKIYEWFHKKFPEYADCRPIFVKKAVQEAGYKIQHIEKAKLFGLPLTIIIARTPE